jgi:flagellar basal-body rod modification protein FlgD
MSNTEFVAQLAQFSALEQMTAMNENISFSNATALIGKTIATSDGSTGVVTSVTQDDGSMYVYIGTTKYALSDVVSVTTTSTTTS